MKPKNNFKAKLRKVLKKHANKTPSNEMERRKAAVEAAFELDKVYTNLYVLLDVSDLDGGRKANIYINDRLIGTVGNGVGQKLAIDPAFLKAGQNVKKITAERIDMGDNLYEDFIVSYSAIVQE